jgi:hypothetical protein
MPQRLSHLILSESRRRFGQKRKTRIQKHDQIRRLTTSVRRAINPIRHKKTRKTKRRRPKRTHLFHLRTTPMKPQPSNSCSPNSLPPMVWARKTLCWYDPKRKFSKYSKILGSNSRLTYSMLFLNVLRRSKERFWIKSAAIASKLLSTKCQPQFDNFCCMIVLNISCLILEYTFYVY